jgi:hypothetical protein
MNNILKENKNILNNNLVKKSDQIKNKTRSNSIKDKNLIKSSKDISIEK